MDEFHYEAGVLRCEDVPLSEIAGEAGTPAYVYSYGALERAYRELDEAFSGLDHLVCYAVKANGNLAVLRALASFGAGADVVSGGELYRAMRAGFDPKKVVFAGVGKTERELMAGLGERERLADGDAELVQGPPRGDVLVGFGVHVRVDPQGYAGPLAVPGGEPVEVLELRSRLDVEEQYALAQPRHELPLRLADPGEDYLLRVEPGAHRPVELADGDDVGPRPEGGQSAQNGEVPVRLDRVADQVIQARKSLV